MGFKIDLTNSGYFTATNAGGLMNSALFSTLTFIHKLSALRQSIASMTPITEAGSLSSPERQAKTRGHVETISPRTRRDTRDGLK
jgi:hypothetical protein